MQNIQMLITLALTENDRIDLESSNSSERHPWLNVTLLLHNSLITLFVITITINLIKSRKCISLPLCGYDVCNMCMTAC